SSLLSIEHFPAHLVPVEILSLPSIFIIHQAILAPTNHRRQAGSDQHPAPYVFHNDTLPNCYRNGSRVATKHNLRFSRTTKHIRHLTALLVLTTSSICATPPSFTLILPQAGEQQASQSLLDWRKSAE
ncbi:unnamed protein product, partial [Fusarium graminearum]